MAPDGVSAPGILPDNCVQTTFASSSYAEDESWGIHLSYLFLQE